MLFNDTVICPACRHVLDQERAAMVDTADLGSRSEQIPCRSCGEANQIGLVRCWNCSAFLREDIQTAYHNLLRGDREVIYSQPGDQKNTEPEPDSSPAASSPGDPEDDDDFELSDAYTMTNPAPPKAEASSETYSLSQPDPPHSSNGSESKTTASSQTPAESPKPPNPTTAPSQQNGETKSDKTEKSRPRPQGDDSNTEDHSVATGGDVLLDIALKEEEEAEKRRKKREAKTQRRKKSKKKRAKDSKPGSTPSPERLAAQKKALARQKAAKRKAAARKRKAQQKFGVWLADVPQHTINPQKLKLKPGSVEKQSVPVDVGCSAEGLIVVGLSSKPAITLFSKPKSDPQETRKQVREHLESDKDRQELPAASHQFFEKESVDQIKVVQPVVYVHESMFAGIPIFGEGRVAVRLPQPAEEAKQQFLSFRLTEFRKFSQGLEKYFEVKDLGLLDGVPLTDPILDLECHYSDEPIKAIDPDAVKFYEADPNFKLELAGRRCENCELVISEDARRKEKIGGLNGKAIARAKCPKCEKRFGSTSLFQLAGQQKPSAEETPAAVK